MPTPCRALTALLLVTGLGLPARAAQVVTLDLKPTGDVHKNLAAALTPVMVAELSRHRGISVVSQADVMALLEHEARRQQVGCSETACMTEIAGSLGAELLVSGTVGRVGQKWLVSLSMLQVAGGQVFRRATGEAQGGEEMAAQAVVEAVHAMMREGLPADVMGPASLSRRGFQAALLGFTKVALDPAQDPRAARKRIVLDLVNTELDYDAAPKLDMLDLGVRRGVAQVEKDMMTAKDAKDFSRYMAARGQWLVLGMDLQRVKEIRQRARERGMVPSATPLRFEDPEPVDTPDPDAVARYQKEAAAGRAVAERALKAYLANDEAAFRKEWLPEEQDRAGRVMADGLKSDDRYGYTHDLLPFHATPPWMYRDAVRALEDDKNLVVFFRRYRKGTVDDDRRVHLRRDGNAWRIRSWL